MEITVTVNGERVTSDVEPARPNVQLACAMPRNRFR